MKLMKENGQTIYFKMSPKSLALRLSNSKRLRPITRDIAPDNMLSFVTEQLSEREVFYNQADIIIKGENLNLDELVNKIQL
jgi:shikimate kinase